MKLKRKVASLVKSLQKKSLDVHRMLVTRFPILSRVPPVLMQQLCLKSQKKLFQRKYTLIQQGEVSDWIFLVSSGSLGIYQQSEHVLSTSGGMSVGVNNELTGGTASAALAATSKKYESLHIGDVAEGDEAGLFGLLRPPTIVQLERRKKVKKLPAKSKGTNAKAAADGEATSESSADEEQTNEHRKAIKNRLKERAAADYRGGYIQPHTVIANQPSIVYAISARLFRSMLLSVPELYVEIRDLMTNVYCGELRSTA